jgi:hypothetical protein
MNAYSVSPMRAVPKEKPRGEKCDRAKAIPFDQYASRVELAHPQKRECRYGGLRQPNSSPNGEDSSLAADSPHASGK